MRSVFTDAAAHTLLPTPSHRRSKLGEVFFKQHSQNGVCGGHRGRNSLSKKAAGVHPGRLAVLLLARLLEGGGEFFFFFFFPAANEKHGCVRQLSLSLPLLLASSRGLLEELHNVLELFQRSLHCLQCMLQLHPPLLLVGNDLRQLLLFLLELHALGF